jgi:hypothetical protein
VFAYAREKARRKDIQNRPDVGSVAVDLICAAAAL